MFSGSIITILLSLLLLQSGEGIRLFEAGGPKLSDKEEQTELAVVVFEVEIGADGSVIGNKLIQGPPEFVERSRLALKDWKFVGVDPKLTPIPAGVVFLYRPRPEFPDEPMAFDQPVPDRFDEEYRSPFPVTVVDPGYPLGAFGEGSVILQVTTNPNGKVEKLDVVSGVPSLTGATAAAVRDWEFYVPHGSQKQGGISIVVAVYRSPEYKVSSGNTNAATR
jgi:hypothetical protein